MICVEWNASDDGQLARHGIPSPLSSSRSMPHETSKQHREIFSTVTPASAGMQFV